MWMLLIGCDASQRTPGKQDATDDRFFQPRPVQRGRHRRCPTDAELQVGRTGCGLS